MIACNRMDIPSGRKALLEGCCDAVGLCRPFLADPDLGRKLRKGREPEIRSCLSCNQECLDRVFAGKPVGCAVNPFVGQEDKAWIDADQGKHILVIGAGISGMAYAALAARKKPRGGVGKVRPVGRHPPVCWQNFRIGRTCPDMPIPCTPSACGMGLLSPGIGRLPLPAMRSIAIPYLR